MTCHGHSLDIAVFQLKYCLLFQEDNIGLNNISFAIHMHHMRVRLDLAGLR